MPLRTRILSTAILMGFFSSLFGCSGNNTNSRYVNEHSFQGNRAKQTAMSPLTVAQLRQHGVTDQATLELEVFFYTDTEAKSTALAASLKALNYDVQIGASSGEGQPYIVTGQTIPIAMDEHSVVEWTDQMCRIGYKHDCLFDGWGTNLEQ